MDLIAQEEIRRLKYRYLRTLDMKQWDEFATVFTSDATADYGSPSGGRPLKFAGRGAIVSYMREALGGSGITTAHFCGQPEIDIDGDTAAGSWCMEDTIIVAEHQVLIKGAAFYHDRYRRDGGHWKISHTGYVRTYETMVSFADLPRFRLTANMWG